MARSTRIGLAGILGCVLLALVLLASGLSELQFRPGGSFMSSGSGFFNAIWLLAGIALFLPIVLVLLLRESEYRGRILKGSVLLGCLIVLSYVLLVLQRDPVRIPSSAELLASPAASRDPRQLPTPQPLGSTLSTPQNLPAPPRATGDPPPWLTFVLEAILIAALLAGMWVFWSRRSAPVAEAPSGEQLVAQQAQEALAGLNAGGDVRKTILQCYLEMSAVLSERRGVRRGQAMTVRDFERRLAEVGIADTHVRRLTRLFERARYGAGSSDQRDKDEAQACLTAIVQTYGGRP